MLMFSRWIPLGVALFLLTGSLITTSTEAWALLGNGAKTSKKSETPSKKKPKPCQFIPATTVCLTPPDGFTPATSFNGYLDTKRNAWIMVSEISEAYDEVTQGMTTELLEKEGLRVVERRDIYLQGDLEKEEAFPAQLLSVRQRVKSTEYFKWILMFGNDKKTIMVNAFYPLEEKYSTPLKNELHATLMATQWDPKRRINKHENLSFKVKPQKGLKLAQRMQNTLLYTQTGETPNASPEDPMFIIGRSFFEQKISDPLAFAKTRITQFPTMKDVQIKSVTPTTVDQLEGFEMIALAKDKQTSSPMALYQMMLFDGHHYYIMVGAVGANDTQGYSKRFKKTAQTFKRK